ncbi:MAG: hypothetical protein R3F14_31290 [Polyangiaceae bacterium]
MLAGAPRLAGALLVTSLLPALAAGCRCKGDLTSPLVQDFEGSPGVTKWPRDAPGEVTLSTDWHAGGATSLRIDPGLLAALPDLRRTDLRGFDALRVHLHNPSRELIPFGFELADEHDSLYDRHRVSFGAPPGDTTLDIDLSGDLHRGEENRPFRGPTKTPLSLASIDHIAFENRGKTPLWIDTLTLVSAPLPAPKGAFAFDFGPARSRTMAHTSQVTESAKPGPNSPSFGWLKGAPSSIRDSMTYPTPLLGDGLAWGDAVFAVDLEGGQYTGWVAFERGGFWETEDDATGYRTATLRVNDSPVFNDTFDPRGPHFFFEDTEVTRVSDAWEKLVLPASAASRFAFEARPGQNTFTLAVSDLRGPPLRVAALILAPDTPEGNAFIDAHLARQKAYFGRTHPDSTPVHRGSPPPKVPQIFVEARPLGDMAHPGDHPDLPIREPAPVQAIAGHPVHLQFFLSGPTHHKVLVRAVAATDPPSFRVASIAQSIYGVKRPYSGGTAWIETQYLRPLAEGETIDIDPETGRTLVVSLDIPPTAPKSRTTLELDFTEGEDRPLEHLTVPIEIHAVDLPPLPIPVGLFMNALPYRPAGADHDTWWSFQDKLLAIQGEAGLNTVTGGPDLAYEMKRAGDEYTFSGETALRYLALANKHGLDRAVVCYSGFLPSLKHERPEAAAFTRSWQAFETSHALPPHYVYSYDEPSTKEELSAVAEYMAPFKAAGTRTIGFFADPGNDSKYAPVMDSTFAPAVSGHTPDLLRRWVSEGKHVFLYNRGTGRLSMGSDLYWMIAAGASGRLEWIGLYSQGFAFDDLDGREPSYGMFVAHDRLGPLPTPRWLAMREGLIDARLMLALAAKHGPTALREAGYPDSYPADPEKWTDDLLARARAAAIRALER